MRWDRLFEDLEDQLCSEWEAERAALDSEAERLRLSRVMLRDRLRAIASRDRAQVVASFELVDGTIFSGEVSGVGADWAAIDPTGQHRGIVVPLSAICAIGMPHADLLRSARPVEGSTALADRMTFGFVLRDFVRRRLAVTIHRVHGATLAGTIDRAGADHLDIALHDPGVSRRAELVSGHRIVPFGSVAWVRPEIASPLI
ncbi:hypothetical protein [Microbacterium rhizomatis]|uniref:Uncharacterized protein n=1 Tax=Microbacterium rhizomatis TaxID=1631477 RepID=A0A5J5J863_9MICO|nr:hypothetical protein [Microbacterium rhizomatis]KAA9111195.1 hypothetical protein F6B43_06250 [Microbacterium rhizomatis]